METEKLREALLAILDYLWDDELKDFEESGCPEGHIFEALKTVRLWLFGK